MTLWEFACCVDGWNVAQGGEPPIEAPSADEFYEMVERLH